MLPNHAVHFGDTGWPSQKYTIFQHIYQPNKDIKKGIVIKKITLKSLRIRPEQHERLQNKIHNVRTSLNKAMLISMREFENSKFDCLNLNKKNIKSTYGNWIELDAVLGNFPFLFQTLEKLSKHIS